MRLKILLLILLYSSISRFFLIDKIPPVIDSNVLNGRFISAATNIGSVFLIFLLTRYYLKNNKVALLSSWAFGILPWTFEQGRIVSQVNISLFLILLTFSVIKIYFKFSTRLKYLLLLLIIPILFFVFPQFWLFKMQEFKFSINSFTTNIFILTSFEFLFFKNITFWWGGIREFGVMFLSFVPFFLLGFYRFIIAKEKLLMPLLLMTVIAALSPFFPESREFYLAVPIISMIVGWGIYRWFSFNNIVTRTILIFLFLVLTYELFQYLHFYFIHYPQQIQGNFSQIHEPF